MLFFVERPEEVDGMVATNEQIFDVQVEVILFFDNPMVVEI
jgi:hypothetical protein